MSKLKKQYVCNACGGVSPKWLGQCPDCREWNTLIEEAVETAKASINSRLTGYAGSAGAAELFTLDAIEYEEKSRRLTGLKEFDRVLGGGLVQGSIVLVGGDPGIGKSTILLQTLVFLSKSVKTLYVTGEESPSQIAMRAQRLNLKTDLNLLVETSVEKIIKTAEPMHADVLVIDSIQTVYTEMLNSVPGNVGQVRESTALLTRFAKRNNTTVFLVGHVTKEGAIAGPRVLEHMVDSVIYFEGEAGSRYRVMRAIKNRFGPVNEIGVFAMTETGVKGVSNPSAIFLSRHEKAVSGSVIMVSREGTRPLLLEIQALVDQCFSNYPRRVALGVEQNRLAMLLAVLHRHAGVQMNDQDVYVNVVGGVKVSETGSDLAVLVAAYSSFKNLALANDLVIFGEVGLVGEVRPVPNGEERLKEASKHGFKKAIVPKPNVPKSGVIDMEIIAVNHLSEVIDYLKS